MPKEIDTDKMPNDNRKVQAESKHLKGQLDPPVSDVTVFGPKEVGFHGF